MPDLTICDREPIHIPGFIQPQGALLAIRPGDFLITQASANLASVLGWSADMSLGRPFHEVLGRPLQEVLGYEVRLALQDFVSRDVYEPHNVFCLVGPGGSRLSLRAHHSGPVICVEIEALAPDVPGGRSSVSMAQSVLRTLTQTAGLNELCAVAAQEFKVLTGYDRVMVYRFDKEGNGEVVGESLEPALPPYLGLHYPATDIPAQARRLFQQQRVRLIADIAYVPVPVLSDAALHDGTQLDMTLCALRAVSPVHIEYLDNMGVTATFGVALTYEDKLWGLVVGHHGRPRWMDTEHRAAVDILGQMMASLIKHIDTSELRRRETSFSSAARSLGPRLVLSTFVNDALAAPETELLQVTQADGAMIRIAGSVRTVGKLPAAGDAARAMAVLSRDAAGDLLAVDDLGLRYPELAACTRDGSGALLLPLSPGTDDAILWFRPEALQTVTWGGNPNKPIAVGTDNERLSPRKSFDAWRQLIRGRSLRWSGLDVMFARELLGVITIAEAERQRDEQRLVKVRALELETNLLATAALASSQAEAKLKTAHLVASEKANRALGLTNDLLIAKETAKHDSEDRFRRVVEAALSAMIITDCEGKIWLVNSQAEETFGYSRKEMLGKPIELLVPFRFRGHHPGLRTAFFANPQSRPMGAGRDLFGLKKDGSEFPMEIGLNPVETEHGSMVLSAIVDITQRRRNEMEKERHRRELERSNADLEEFAYVASHDLKEPLRGIANNARFLIEDYGQALDEAGVARLLRLGYLSQRMEQLINDLLYFSRLGHPEPEKQLTDLNVVLGEIESMSETMLVESNASIVLPRPMPVVLCNRVRITEVFRNLIINAVKYNDKEKKTVEIGYDEVIRKHDKTVGRVYYVKDDGMGIAEEFHEEIFRIFKRLNTEDDDRKGSGVGLTFVRRIVERDGGRIWLTSKSGEGSIFYFTMD